MVNLFSSWLFWVRNQVYIACWSTKTTRKLFKLDHQSSQQALKGNCSNIYTVVWSIGGLDWTVAKRRRSGYGCYIQLVEWKKTGTGRGKTSAMYYWISQGGHTFETYLVTSLSHLSNNSVLVHFSSVLFWNHCVLKQNNWEVKIVKILVLNTCLDGLGFKVMYFDPSKRNINVQATCPCLCLSQTKIQIHT